MYFIMKYVVYILTDCNRKSLHVGLTDNLSETVLFYKENKHLFFDAADKVSRLVYSEEFFGEESAIARFHTIAAFTRSQKERLIRASNKDWVDLSLKFNRECLLAPSIRFSSARR